MAITSTATMATTSRLLSMAVLPSLWVQVSPMELNAHVTREKNYSPQSMPDITAE